MAKTTTKLSLKNLIEEARDIADQLQEALPRKPDHKTSSLTQAEDLLSEHTGLESMAKRLEMGGKHKFAAINGARQLYSDKLTASTPNNQVMGYIKLRLGEVSDEMKKLHRTHANNWIGSTKSAAEEAVTEEAEKRGSGFIKRVWNKHEQLLEGKSDMGRLGIAVSEIVLGGVLTNVGGMWLAQSRRGLKESSIVRTDESGRPIADVVVTPMANTERILKAALGTASLGVGIGGTILGFVGVFRGGR